jgi:hypothetical protein
MAIYMAQIWRQNFGPNEGKWAKVFLHPNYKTWAQLTLLNLRCSKNAPNLPFLAQEAQMIFFHFLALLTVGSCTRLLEEHVQKVL